VGRVNHREPFVTTVEMLRFLTKMGNNGASPMTTT
jgi:hypothetical protein